MMRSVQEKLKSECQKRVGYDTFQECPGVRQRRLLMLGVQPLLLPPPHEFLERIGRMKPMYRFVCSKWKRHVLYSFL